MKITGEIELSGIKRIVINRIACWERRDIDGGYQIWWKVAGGSGSSLLLSPAKRRTPYVMMAHVNRLLAMGMEGAVFHVTRKGDRVGIWKRSLAYRCWVHGDTLNIVRKDLP